MKGTLRLADAAGSQEIELSRQRMILRRSPSSRWEIHSSTENIFDGVGEFRWDQRRSSWAFLSHQSDSLKVTCNGRDLSPGEDVPLQHLDLIEIEGTYLQFERRLAAPIFLDNPVRSIELKETPLVFGSGRDGSGGPQRVNLDAEDQTISRVHAAIVREGQDYFIEDQSSLGTELNGLAFKREKLVFGDRFRISNYIFQFTGNALNLVEPECSGSVIASGLTKVAGGKRILDGISLNIRAGEFIGILGRSGQGKSTFLTALCGINLVSSGEVAIGGATPSQRERLREIGIGYVPQDDIVHQELTVLEAITFSARLRLKLEEHLIDDLVGSTIDKLGLKPHAHKRIYLLSGGQRKRVSIAIELLGKPSVLFLDEPSSGLDPATEAELMTLLQSLTLTKLTVVCTTHVLHKAYLFDRILVIEGGKLIFAGNGDEARQHFIANGAAAPADALEHSPLEKIYSILQQNDRDGGKKSAADWEREFNESPFAKRAFPPVPQKSSAAVGQAPSRETVGVGSAIVILAKRQWSILRSAPLNLAFIAAQPVLIGGLVGWACEEAALRMFLCVVASMWFGCSNGAQQIVSELSIYRRERICGLGLNSYILSKVAFLSLVSLVQAGLLLFTTLSVGHLFNGARTEMEDFKKDLAVRMTPPVPADLPPMEDFQAIAEGAPATKAAGAGGAASGAVASVPTPPKFWQVAIVAYVSDFFQVTQNILDSGPRVLTGSDDNPVRDRFGREQLTRGLNVWGVLTSLVALRLLAVGAAAVVSVGIGLAISSLVENSTQAVLWVPLVLIPQILFGGMVIRVPEMSKSVRAFSCIMPSFLSQKISDVSAVLAMDTPALTNRTKTPIFLSSLGEKESISWTLEGQSFSQDYDKISDFNASWQNLTVNPGLLGQHKWEKAASANGEFVYPDSVKGRRDVALPKGTPFLNMSPVYTSAAILAGWLCICYTTISAGLIRSQKGR